VKDEELSQTQRLRLVAPKLAWIPRWARERVTVPIVVSTVAAIFCAGSQYANLLLFSKLSETRTAIKELRTEVREVANKDNQARLDERTQDLEKRLSRLEADYDYAVQQAGRPPRAARRHER
jgi:hypothetical protein